MAAKKTTKKPATKQTTASNASKVPTSAELAAMFGVTVQKRMPPKAIWALRKAVPGYAAMLDDAARLLEDEGAALEINGVTPADLLAAQEEYRYLSTREAVLHTVYRSVYEQRLRLDDRAMKMLEKIARRVTALEEDDQEISMRWKLLLDFLSTFRRGGGKKAEPAEEEEEESEEEEEAPVEG